MKRENDPDNSPSGRAIRDIPLPHLLSFDMRAARGIAGAPRGKRARLSGAVDDQQKPEADGADHHNGRQIVAARQYFKEPGEVHNSSPSPHLSIASERI